jgi:hypothetical protein
MSDFVIWWVIWSPFCLIPVAIDKKISEKDLERSTYITPIALIVYWILLGLVQGQLLNTFIPYSYIWSLVTIFGGLISSWLLITGFKSALYILLKDVQIVGLGGDFPGARDCWISIIILITSLFSSGFLLGLEQSIVFYYLINLNYFNSIIPGITIPLVTAGIWFLTVPILGIIISTCSEKKYFLIYVSLILAIAILVSLIEGLLIEQILILSS